MLLQAADFHHVWAYMRDHARPVSQQDAADLAAVREPAPPTLDHFARLKRDRAAFVQPPRPSRAPKPADPERARVARSVDQWQRYRAAAGGSRTVRPIPGFGTGPNRPHAPCAAVSSNRELDYDNAVVGLRQRQAADALRALWGRYHGPLTRFQQAEYAFVTDEREDVIYVPTGGFGPAPADNDGQLSLF